MTPEHGEGGGSEPHLFQTDGGQFMVKVANNPQGRRVMVNELVRGMCLSWLGVCHPRPAIVDVPEDVIADSPGAHFNNGERLAHGLAFGSEYWHSDAQGTVGAEKVVNVSDVAGTCVADTWIHNHDGLSTACGRSRIKPTATRRYP
jgi:hypothetical protein